MRPDSKGGREAASWCRSAPAKASADARSAHALLAKLYKEGMVVIKAVACVLRRAQGGRELLVFRHPDGTVQIPKGTVESGESPSQAVLRELEEEYGVSGMDVRAEVCQLRRRLPSGPEGNGPLEPQLWHVFWLESHAGIASSWRHVVSAGAVEAGLVFSFRWLLLEHAAAELDPLFGPVAEALVEAEAMSDSESRKPPPPPH